MLAILDDAGRPPTHPRRAEATDTTGSPGRCSGATGRRPSPSLRRARGRQRIPMPWARERAAFPAIGDAIRNRLNRPAAVRQQTIAPSRGMRNLARAATTGGAYYADWDELRAHVDAERWDIQAHTDDLHRMQMTEDGELPALTSLADGESIEAYPRPDQRRPRALQRPHRRRDRRRRRRLPVRCVRRGQDQRPSHRGHPGRGDRRSLRDRLPAGRPGRHGPRRMR